MNRRTFLSKSLFVPFAVVAGTTFCFGKVGEVDISPVIYHGELGVRNLMADIKRDIEKISYYFRNEPITLDMIMKFKLFMREVLQKKYVNKGLIYNFTLVNEECKNLADNTSFMKGTLTIQPMNRVEWIVLDFALS